MSLLLLFPVSGPRAISFDAAAGSFSLTGQAATLSKAAYVNAASTSYTHTGQTANLAIGRALNLASTTFSISGQDVTFNRSYVPLNSDSTSYTLTGQDAEFARTFSSRELNAEYGSFDILGQAAEFYRTRLFNAEQATEGDYFSSDYVDTTYSQGIGYKISPSYFAEDFVQAGYQEGEWATLAYSRLFELAYGEYSITYQDATLNKTSILPAEDDVRSGVVYGPDGIYTGTLVVAPSGGGTMILRRR